MPYYVLFFPGSQRRFLRFIFGHVNRRCCGGIFALSDVFRPFLGLQLLITRHFHQKKFYEKVVGNVFFFQNFQKFRIFIKNWLFYTVSKSLTFYGFLTLFYVYFYVFLGLYVAHSSLILAMTMNFYMFLLLLNIQFFLFIAFFEFYWPYLTLI